MRSLMMIKAAVDRAANALERSKGAASGAFDATLATMYERTDRRPWRLGYVQFRAKFLERALLDDELMARFERSDPLPEGYGYRLDARVVEIPWALSRLEVSSVRRVLDAGSSLNSRVVVESAALHGKELVVTTLAPERRCFWRHGVSYLYGDIRDLVLRDASFDVVCCISTIEHVGMDNTRYAGDVDAAQRRNPAQFLSAVSELKRVLRPGGRLLITFPFGRYEDHGWFQQFDAALADRLVGEFAPVRALETVYRYTAEGWRRTTRTECADCEFFDVQESRYFKNGSTLEFPPHYPAGESAVMCLELVK